MYNTKQQKGRVMKARNGKGRYIRIEGPDGAGKSTQIELARAYAEEQGIPFLVVREPGGTALGQELRNILLHNRDFELDAMTENLIFTADRRHLIHSTILPALNDGYVVVGDRGYESTLAYQSAAGGVSEEAIYGISNHALPEWYLTPDGLVVLNISEKEFERRSLSKAQTKGHDKIEERKIEYFAKVRSKYDELGALSHATAMNGELPAEEIFNTVRPILFGPDHA